MRAPLSSMSLIKRGRSMMWVGAAIASLPSVRHAVGRGGADRVRPRGARGCGSGTTWHAVPAAGAAGTVPSVPRIGEDRSEASVERVVSR